MNEQQVRNLIEQMLSEHRHTGTDNSQQLNGSVFENTPFSALTAKNNSTTQSLDGAIISNNRTRIEQIENILKNLLILPN